MKGVRTAAGYNLVFNPSHPKCYKTENWNGYIYEHIIIAEKELGRYLNDGEEVHHLDFNKKNNRPENLLVLSKIAHCKLHFFLRDYKDAIIENTNIKIKNKLCQNHHYYCKVCSKVLDNKHRHYCSLDCYKKSGDIKSKVDISLKDEILNKLTMGTMRDVAKEYNISDNGLKKWLKKNVTNFKTFKASDRIRITDVSKIITTPNHETI